MQMAHTSILPLPKHFLSPFQLSQFPLIWFTSFFLPKSNGTGGGNHSATEASLLSEGRWCSQAIAIPFHSLFCFMGVKKVEKRQILHKQTKVD